MSKMSALKKLIDKEYHDNERSEDSDDPDPEKSNVQPGVNENKKPTVRRAVRGRTAALLAASDDSDDSDDEDCYLKKINHTKKEMKDIHNTLDTVDKKLLIDTKENEAKKKASRRQQENSNSDNGSSSDSDDSYKDSKKKIQKRKSISPPPPPPSLSTKPKRKSNNAVEKQLQRLENFKNTQHTLLNDDPNKSLEVNEDDDFDEIVTVKVLTKNGVTKFQIKETEPFRLVYEKLSQMDNTNIENLLLMLDDRKINLSDTPKSIDLKIYQIIECGKVATIVKERIQIIDNEDEEASENLPDNQLVLSLQTQEGRKSRIKFLIYKDEKFVNILKLYCEKKSLDFNLHILEFDGDKVDLEETPEDLDLDGDEMMDVKKSSKPTSQVISENKKKYEFDDDILCV